VVFLTYTLVSFLNIAAMADAKSENVDLFRSYTKAPLYIIVQLVSCICWIVFAIQSWLLKKSASGDHASTYICEYQIRNQQRVHQYAHQCSESGENIVTDAVLANMGLAFLVIVTKSSHIVFTFVIGPFLSLNTARASLFKKGVIKNPGQLGISNGFALSDLYFAMLTGCLEKPTLNDETYNAEDVIQEKT